ncbi:ATP-binding cassette domain-containing protein [Nakamurella lactea]|jgi:peptide/nickel transport system ATP-binding protein|uniref:ATP-binding cassette domain-containing protein n=1 Tax=Nakamurella lactea TaxID=459515 RepID=UPI0003FA5441|nr:dipeptide/oligopeptide/nickel ABC transporter ATP-binding protein [Nakamurella lactea]
MSESKVETTPPKPPPLLAVDGLTVVYPGTGGGRKKAAPAVRDVSFQLSAGRTLALVGESGSGKTTTGRACLGLVPATGSVRIRGRELVGLRGRRLAEARQGAQMIFQDPLGSLDPRWSVRRIIAEAGALRPDEPVPPVEELLEEVGLQPALADRRPPQMSGGQRQRVAIARALAARPDLVVCDEPTSALDVSVAARVIDLLQELQDRLDAGYLFISHDLSLVRSLADKVVVMKDGEIVEAGATEEIFGAPTMVYTRTLIDAAMTYSLDGAAGSTP